MRAFWIIYSTVFGVMNGYYLVDDIHKSQWFLAAWNGSGLVVCLFVAVLWAVRGKW